MAINYTHNVEVAEAALAQVELLGTAALFKTDVLTEEGVHQLVNEVIAKQGAPNKLVFNAMPVELQKSIEKQTSEDFVSMSATLIMSPHYLT